MGFGGAVIISAIGDSSDGSNVFELCGLSSSGQDAGTKRGGGSESVEREFSSVVAYPDVGVAGQYGG